MDRRSFLAASSIAALGIAGCNPKQNDAVPTAPADESKLRELKVVLVEDEPFAEILVRDWKSTSQRPFSVQSVTVDELRKMKEIAADVVIYPPRMIGELAESGRIAPLDEQTLEKPELAREEIIDLARTKLGVWGQRVFGIPLSTPQLLMVYQKNKIASPPQSWQEFDELCKSLPSDCPAALDPLAEETRSLVLLSRAASRARGKNQHSTLFDIASLKPLIATPPFIQALEELVARAQGKQQEALATTTKMVWEQLAGGKVAMGLTWPVAAEASEGGATVDSLSFSKLPGSRSFFVHAENRMEEGTEVRHFPVLGGAGRLISAIRGKMGLRDGANLLVLLSGKARAGKLGLATIDAFPCRQSQLSQAEKWLGALRSEEPAKRFVESVSESLTARDSLIATNLPGEAEYTSALNTAIEKTVLANGSAAENLAAAASEWEAITEKLGREKQKLAYLRSLGLEEFH